MTDLTIPWWEFIFRASLVYLVLLAMIRLSGKRTIGQFTPFDLLVIMLLSEAVSNSMTAGDESLAGGLIIAATLIALNVAFGYLTARSQNAANLIDGAVVLIGKDGQIFEDILKRNRVGMADVQQSLREADCELQEMKRIFLEADGSISVMKIKH